VGSILGTRTVVNEIVAFQQLHDAIKGVLSERSVAIATFAVCGFANLSSIGIQIGGLGALVPERKSDIARLGLLALVAATLANFSTACVAGALFSSKDRTFGPSCPPNKSPSSTSAASTSKPRRAGRVRARAEHRVPRVRVRRHHPPRDPGALIADAYRAVKAFFALPLETKVKYEVPGSGGARGYTRFGVEHAKDSSRRST
jgi:hypothetical protein